ncbi:MAG: LpxI family protein [Alphaproteobacteria bacterium]|nr:LpxI family protein [Alphaproteobacteria bacterium]
MRLCIVAGGGQLPAEIIARAISDKVFYAIIGIRNQHNLNLNQYKNSIELDIGQVGAALEFCAKYEISHVVFAGKIARPNISSIVPADTEGAKLLWRIGVEKFLGDDKLLKVVVAFFEEKGLVVLGASDFLEDNILAPGPLTNSIIPSRDDLENIEIGKKALLVMSPLDIGQSIIIANKRIIAVEAAEGTDEMIKRSVNYTTSDNSLLIKMPKQSQDTRVDMPTIGPKTIENMKKSNIKGLAISKNVILLGREEVIKNAEDARIFIYIIE